jgi:hypothetical protein
MTDTQKQAWKEGASGLDIALVDSPAFVKWWPWVWKIVLVIAVGAFGRFASQASDAHKAKLKAIETAPVVLPELVTPKLVKAKTATNKVAAKAINTPAASDMGIPISQTKKSVEPETQFDRDLTNFESKL